MDKKSLAIIGLIICLAIAVSYIFYNIWVADFINTCTRNTLQGIADHIMLRGAAIQIKVGQDNLICSTEAVLNANRT